MNVAVYYYNYTFIYIFTRLFGMVGEYKLELRVGRQLVLVCANWKSISISTFLLAFSRSTFIKLIYTDSAFIFHVHTFFCVFIRLFSVYLLAYVHIPTFLFYFTQSF